MTEENKNKETKIIKKMTKTFLRSEKTMMDYYNFSKNKKKNKKDVKKEVSFLDRLDEIVIKKFKYWVIIPNRFPYDAIAEINHMLFIKRDVKFDWDLLKEEEKEELIFLKKNYLSENYDSILENLPAAQTVPGRFHLHLLKLKREEFEI